MTRKYRNKRKQRSFFHASSIVTNLQRHLERDLRVHTHEYMDSDFTRYFRSRLVSDFQKKFVAPSIDTTPLESLTFEKFLEVNSHLAKYNELEFPDPSKRLVRGMQFQDKVLLRARALMHHVVGDITTSEWFAGCKHSSGSSIGVPFSDTSIEAKFTFPISGTARVEPFMYMYLSYDGKMREAVEEFNRESPIQDWYTYAEGSRASTVEKSSTARRMICVEPTANMFLQQGLMTVLYDRMREFGLDVESLPELHKKQALRSSISSAKATIDWSSASDCVSIELLRYLLPPKWFNIVDAVRCPYTSLNGVNVELQMISTMGNAVTFPLETLVFWTFAHAVRLSLNIHNNSLFPEWEDLKECSVFGDDCIVPSYMAEDFISAVEKVGFIINKEKSFYGSEKFRESCGGDYLAGRNVRPYNVKAPTSEKKSALEPWLYIVANQLIRKYIMYFGVGSYVYDKRVFEYLFQLFREHKLEVKLVPPFYPDDAGLKIAFDIERFIVNYRIELCPIYRNQHGSYRFHYKRFVYRTRGDRFDLIRYAALLKGFAPEWDEEPDEFELEEERLLVNSLAFPKSKTVTKQYDIRRIGGYVEAVGETGHWSIPGLKFKTWRYKNRS